METTPKENKQMKVALSAINPVLETNIVDATETEVKGKDFIAWGKNNDYPDYLFSLYSDCPTLQTVINGAVDYSCGDDILINIAPFSEKINDKGETVNQVVRNAYLDYWTYGAFALNVVRNKLGGIAGVYYLDVRKVRSDKKNTFFYYSEDWTKSYGRVKYLTYPAFSPDSTASNSILYVKRTYNGTYPIPVYGAAVKAAEMEKSVDIYHLNAINNNFAASYLISFNNGVPDEQQQEEIEEKITEKYSGQQNAARIMITYASSKDNAVSVEKLDSEDFGVKYESLANRSKQAVFTAFRMNENLAGIPTAQGFNSEEFASSFKLFNKTMILPAQRLMCDAFKKIFGQECLTIKPFTISFEDEGTESQTKIVE